MAMNSIIALGANATANATASPDQWSWEFGTLFIDPDGMSNPQLLFFTGIYGWVLFQSAGLISDGSELLGMIPSVAGLVGSIVLPILGAVPDGMMIVFSGLGPNPKDTVAVGVGALAGSTVMLLTFPMFLALLAGSVPMENGVPQYKRKRDADSGGLFGSGVKLQPSVKKSARIMLLTTLIFTIIQIPASMIESADNDLYDADARNVHYVDEGKQEKQYALIAFIMSIIGFLGYVGWCYYDNNQDKVVAAIIKGVQEKQISLGAAMDFVNESSKSMQDLSKGTPLITKNDPRLRAILRPFFLKYDEDGNKTLDKMEFRHVLMDLSTSVQGNDVQRVFDGTDKDKSGTINFDEFVGCVHHVLTNDALMKRVPKKEMTAGLEDNMGGGDEEEADLPEDIASMPKEKQQTRILMRAFYQMGIGTVLVIIFSDPAVDVLNRWGEVLGINAFYIAFTLAPFASNASELTAAYAYASKKTSASITTSVSQLLGAACMNNTYCLAIFMALVYFNGLAWQFTGETVSIISIQWLIGILLATKETLPKFYAFVILACYPLCLGIVYAITMVLKAD